MQTGDVLIHDVMVIHGSQAAQGETMRRTIYLEFRSVEQILEDGPWDSAWIERRLNLLDLALRRHRQTHPWRPQFEWNLRADFRGRPTSPDSEILRVAHPVQTPGSYCSAGDAGYHSA